MDSIADVGAEAQTVSNQGTQLVLHFLLDSSPGGTETDRGANEAPMADGGIPSFKGAVDLGAVEPGDIAEAFYRTNVIAVQIKKGDSYTNFVWYFTRP